MAEIYEIIIFTASLSQYAKPLIEKLDKEEIGFSQLYREHWTFYEDIFFVKDLSKLGRDLKDVIIIDNSPSAYLFQKENAIPIISWYQNKADKELYKLIPILQKLASVKDVTQESLNNWKRGQFSIIQSPAAYQTIDHSEMLKKSIISKINFQKLSGTVSNKI